MDRQKSAFRWPGKSHFLKPVSTRQACELVLLVWERESFQIHTTHFSKMIGGMAFMQMANGSIHKT